MKKGSKQDFYQLSVRFSPDMGKLIQDRAAKNGRSYSQEVVRLVKAQLAQENGPTSLVPISALHLEV